MRAPARARLAAASLLLLAAHALAQGNGPACKTSPAGVSPFIGTKQSGAKFVDHAPLAARGPLVQVSLYFSKPSGCLRGAKVAFSSATGAPLPGMLGVSANTTEAALKMHPGEAVTKAEYKAGKCIEYVKLTTSAGRSLAVGSASSPAPLATSAANKTGGQLLSLRGFQGVVDGKPGPLQQLQFVWGGSKCSGTLAWEAGVFGAPPRNDDPASCAPRRDMCNEGASMNQFSYCVWNAPFTTSACKGGCCFSSGKCASSSCVISGVGRDVPGTICYGTNAGAGFGGAPECAGLACRLAVPGCTTDPFGGNCVGTVVALGGDAAAVHPSAARFLGAPCLDATPSSVTLGEDGRPAGLAGVFMSKLWTICDCSDAPPGAAPGVGAALLNLTTAGLNNMTKNEVMFAISQALPKVNLTELLDPHGGEAKANLFPSITELFKPFPGLPGLGGAAASPGGLAAAAGNGTAGAPARPARPDLSGLLGALAARAGEGGATAADKRGGGASPVGVAAVGEEGNATAPANGTASPGPTLSGIKNVLSKFVPGLQAARDAQAAKAALAPEAGSLSAEPAPAAVAAPAAAAPAPAAAQQPAAQQPAATPTTEAQPATAPAAEAPAAAAPAAAASAAPAAEVPAAAAPAAPAAQAPAPVAEPPQRSMPFRGFTGLSGFDPAMLQVAPAPRPQYAYFSGPGAFLALEEQPQQAPAAPAEQPAAADQPAPAEQPAPAAVAAVAQPAAEQPASEPAAAQLAAGAAEQPAAAAAEPAAAAGAAAAPAAQPAEPAGAAPAVPPAAASVQV
ncbi:hypothetical protein HT031_005221 [Scenedesmus sp. PABB004]|nr:hypothetical protein HT031_005221 [Scenedesmus sp. PABB004]